MSDHSELILSVIRRGYELKFESAGLNQLTVSLSKSYGHTSVSVEQTIPMDHHFTEGERIRALLEFLRKALLKKETKAEAEGHREIHVLYPVQKQGVWKAAELDNKGYFDPFKDGSKPGFTSKKACKEACNRHNLDQGFTLKEVEAIASQALGGIKFK